MAVLALVQSYPYDAVLGGDAAYIQAFAQYLRQRGHVIHGLITDTTRARSNPFYKSAYNVRQFESWRVRNAIQIQKGIYFGTNRSQVAHVLGKLSTILQARAVQPPPTVENWVQDEAAWVKLQLDRLRPHATILVHGAVHFAPFLNEVGTKFALLGHITRHLKLSDGPQKSSERNTSGNLRCHLSDFEIKLATALRKVDCIGLNNGEDIVYTRETLGLKSVIFVGMGYPNLEVHAESKERIVLFVGNATVPNMTALSWFTKNVWPTVLAACPGSRFRVVGRASLAMNCDEGPSIERVGPVPDLANEYLRAQVVVVPLMSGTAGVKIKVAEAVAHGRPIVTTSLGVDPQDARQLDGGAIVADDPESFATATIALLNDAKLRKLKGSGAKHIFDRHFSYKACYGAFNEWLESVC